MYTILPETVFLLKQSYWCFCCQQKTSFKRIIFTCPWGGVRPASVQSRVKIVLSLAVSASTSGSVSPGVDPYSLMYLYKYTGQVHICTRLCTCTNIQVRCISVLAYVPVQIYRSGVYLYSLMYLYKYTGQVYIRTHLCTSTNIQVRCIYVLTFLEE